MCRLFAEETLYAHDDGVVFADMFGHLFAVFVVELSQEAAVYVVEVAAHFAFLQYHLAFVKFHRHQYALKRVKLVVCHGAVFTRQFACNITLGT